MSERRILACLTLVALVASLASCSNSNSSSSSGSSASGSTETGSTASGEEVILTLPTYYCGENVGAVYFEPAVERFNEKYDGQYEVQLEEVVEASYNDKMSTLAQSGKLPVLISGGSTEWINTVLIPQKLYYDTKDWLNESGIIDLCLDSSVEYSTQEDGSVVGVPIVTVSTTGLYYNGANYTPDKNICDMSMDEFIASLDGQNMAWQTVDNAWTSMLFLTALVANEEGGAEWLQEYDGTKCYDYNTEWMVSAVTKLLDVWNQTGGSTFSTHCWSPPFLPQYRCCFMRWVDMCLQNTVSPAAASSLRSLRSQCWFPVTPRHSRLCS